MVDFPSFFVCLPEGHGHKSIDLGTSEKGLAHGSGLARGHGRARFWWGMVQRWWMETAEIMETRGNKCGINITYP